MADKPFVSKSFHEPTREYLLEICKLYNKDPKTLKDRGPVNGKYDVFVKYVCEITSYEPCIICNAPMWRELLEPQRSIVLPRHLFGYIRRLNYPDEYSSLRCRNFPVHTRIVNMMRENDEEYNEALIRRHFVPCEHGWYICECTKCLGLSFDKGE